MHLDIWTDRYISNNIVTDGLIGVSDNYKNITESIRVESLLVNVD